MNTAEEKNEFMGQINDLIHQLLHQTSALNEPRSLLKAISARPETILPQNGSRTRQMLFKNDQFELVLMQWGLESASPIHGHGGSQCYMQILSGELIETRYRPYNLDPVHEAKLSEGQVTHINDEACFHKLSSNHGAVSLHLYARPLQSMQVFDEERDDWLDKVASEMT